MPHDTHEPANEEIDEFDDDEFDDDEFDGLESMRVVRLWGDDLSIWETHLVDAQRRRNDSLDKAGSQSRRSCAIDLLLDAAHRVALGIARGDDTYAAAKFAALRDIVDGIGVDLGVQPQR